MRSATRLVVTTLLIVTPTLQFKTPLDQGKVPKGYYMLFILTPQGVPSVAEWVQFQ